MTARPPPIIMPRQQHRPRQCRRVEHSPAAPSTATVTSRPTAVRVRLRMRRPPGRTRLRWSAEAATRPTVCRVRPRPWIQAAIRRTLERELPVTPATAEIPTSITVSTLPQERTLPAERRKTITAPAPRPRVTTTAPARWSPARHGARRSPTAPNATPRSRPRAATAPTWPPAPTAPAAITLP